MIKRWIKETLNTVGEYTTLMGQVFRWPMRWRMFFQQLAREIIKYGVDSIGIILIISFFIGTVITIQLNINMSSPMIPRFTIGFASREVILLEFSSTLMSLILVGKVGSSIASELATMRVTEQIDAIDIMGINSANYLILPKVVGLILFIPILTVFSMGIGLFGGYLTTYIMPGITPSDYEHGLQIFFKMGSVTHSIFKSLVYAFIITTVASYFGYTVKGGALGVGRSSTRAVVSSSVLILLADVLLTNLMFLS